MLEISSFHNSESVAARICHPIHASDSLMESFSRAKQTQAKEGQEHQEHNQNQNVQWGY
jgi:hypothetical protein